MRDYATISKRLRMYSENCVAYKLDADFANAVTDAADAIEELLDELTTIRKQLPHWISVEERLPEDLARVIVFCEDGVSYGLCDHLIADDEEVVEWHDFLHYPITTTHWMPLPAPPTEPKGVE